MASASSEIFDQGKFIAAVESMPRKKLNQTAVELAEQMIAIQERSDMVRRSEYAVREIALTLVEWFRNALDQRDMLHRAARDAHELLQKGEIAKAISILGFSSETDLGDPKLLIEMTVMMFKLDDQAVENAKEIDDYFAANRKAQADVRETRDHVVRTIQIASTLLERGKENLARDLLREVSALFPPLHDDKAA